MAQPLVGWVAQRQESLLWQRDSFERRGMICFLRLRRPTASGRATHFGREIEMAKRQIYQSELHAHFVTFSCFRRRRLLESDPCKRIVLGTLAQSLRTNDGRCIGFVIMPNHVHAVLWFPTADCLSDHMNRWKSDSSHRIKQWLQKYRPEYWRRIAEYDDVWQSRYYDFNVYSEEKLLEKLEYMHQNPVRARLAGSAVEWPWSSARWYLNRKPVGISIWYPNG